MVITDIKSLREVSIDAKLEEVDGIAKKLEEELSQHKTGVGLSAIQIGMPKRVCIIKLPGKEKIVLYNVKILEKEEPFKTEENCLSLPGLSILTKRYYTITLKNGDGLIYGANDLEAVCMQHEIDHWNGKLILDRKWKSRG